MSKFLALIVAVAVALFIAGPAMAAPTVTKSVDNTNKADTTFKTDVTVKKDVNFNVKGVDIPATGGIAVDGDSIFKELDVNVQDQENVVKFFELDDEANSKWTITGTGAMNVAEQLQNGLGNKASIKQNPGSLALNQMNVALQYQIGGGPGPDVNTANITQNPLSGTLVNNFAKQIQIGTGNTADITQN